MFCCRAIVFSGTKDVYKRQHERGAKLEYVREISACFGENNTVVGGIRLRYSGELVVLRPVEFAGVHDNSAHYGAVTAYEFRCGRCV